MAKNTCGDCLFKGGKYRWDSDDYCNKLDREVDDDPACQYFLDDSHDCCYDCEGRKDIGLGFYCKIKKRKIQNPGNWVCSDFR